MNRSIFLYLLPGLVLAGLLPKAAFAEETKQDRRSLRVMTFNIRYDNPDDGPDRWSLRRDKVAQIIQNHKIDVVGMQEVLKSQLDDLVTRLPQYAHYGIGRDDGIDRGEFAPIFYRQDFFQLEDKSVFWLSEHPEKIGSLGWDAANTRIATWVKLKDRRSGKIIYVFNTHFDHRGHQARINSAKLLVKKIPRIAGKHPAILMGDFNFRNTSEAYKILLSGQGPAKLFDTRQISQTPSRGFGSTFNGFQKLNPGQTIDHIFVRDGIKAMLHVALNEKTDQGRFASDHLPVFTELKLP